MTRIHATQLVAVLGLALAPSVPAQTTQPATTQVVASQSQPSLTPDQLLLQGAEAVATGDVQAALKAYEQVLAVQPDNVNALIGLGDAILAQPSKDPQTQKDIQRDVQRAKQNYERALKLSPNDWRAHFGVGTAWLDSRAYRMARLPLERARDLVPPRDRPRVLLNLMSTYAGLYQIDDAIRTAREGLRLEPDNFRFRGSLIELYGRTGRIEDAVAESRAGIDRVRENLARQPDNAQAIRDLSSALGQLVALLGKQIEAQPDDAAVRVQLVEAVEQQILANQQLSYHEMLLLLEPVLEKNPENPDLLFTHARLAYLVGRPTLAFEQLQKALKIAPNDTRVRELLTRVEAALKPAAAN